MKIYHITKDSWVVDWRLTWKYILSRCVLLNSFVRKRLHALSMLSECPLWKQWMWGLGYGVSAVTIVMLLANYVWNSINTAFKPQNEELVLSLLRMFNQCTWNNLCSWKPVPSHSVIMLPLTAWKINIMDYFRSVPHIFTRRVRK